MTMKNKKLKIVMSIIGIVMTFFTTITLVFAWKVFSDTASSITLQVTKIDSEIHLYQAIDDNYNGVPNLLSRYSESSKNEILSNYPTNKSEYYKEKYAFNYIGYKYATSQEPTYEDILKYNFGQIYPTQIKTLKFSAVNKSDGTNYISFSFNEKEYENVTKLNILKCMSVRVGRVINVDNNINSDNIKIEFLDKVYFNDVIDTKLNSFDVLKEEDAYEIKGSINKNSEINDDVVDLWFQFEFEDYNSLVNHSLESNSRPFNLSHSVYKSLQGESLDLPDLKLKLEVRVN
jgi:hypothetical protein